MSTPKVSYNVVDKNTHDILVDAILDGGIGYTDKAGEVHQIDAKYGGGSSSLPEVTSDDNGDVLTVVEGAWAKAAPSGGISYDAVIKVTATYDASVEPGGDPTITYTAESGTFSSLWAKMAIGYPNVLIYAVTEYTNVPPEYVNLLPHRYETGRYMTITAQPAGYQSALENMIVFDPLILPSGVAIEAIPSMLIWTANYLGDEDNYVPPSN